MSVPSNKRGGKTAPAHDESFVSSARERAIDAYDSARASASAAGKKAGASLSDAPMIALAGGLAAGALIAALLPRTDREKQLLGPVGEKLTDGARAAVDAAKSAGREGISGLGLTGERGSEVVKSIIQEASDAAIGSIRSRS